MNITEANDLNTLLRYVLNVPDLTRTIPSDDEGREAAEHLAEKAYKALSAGLTAADVAAAWPELLLDNNTGDDGDTSYEEAVAYLQSVGVRVRPQFLDEQDKRAEDWGERP